MASKTENLAIMMTDIVDFTQITVHQSRFENEQLLAKHNEILLPILRHYGGRHVKSIGDALLTVFRSPTDAMLCAMAMQDALFEHNQDETKQPIHIRIGASLGEVRVTRNDIFGEPVNLTSRVEGVTPADEIYLTEALYMAMNKAEVPAEEVGFTEIKGLKEPVRLYSIPRFSESRLVPQETSTEDLEGISYPFGGAHLGFSETGKRSKFRVPESISSIKPLRLSRGIWIIPLLAAAAAIFWLGKYSGINQTSIAAPTAYSANLTATPTSSTVKQASNQAPVNNEPARPSKPWDAAGQANKPASQLNSLSTEIHGPPAPPQTVASTDKSATIAATTPPATKAVVAKPTKPKTIWNVRKAKTAYRERRISKARYNDIIYDLKVALKKNIVAEKTLYRARKISKAEYKKRVRKLEADYRG